MTVTPEDGENDDAVHTALKLMYSEKYPDEAPLCEIFSQGNLEYSDITDTLKLFSLQAKEDLGVVVIFTLVTAVQEKLNEVLDKIKTRRKKTQRKRSRRSRDALMPWHPCYG